MLGEVGMPAPMPTIKANRTFENCWLTVAAPWAAFTVPFDEVELSQYCAPQRAPKNTHNSVPSGCDGDHGCQAGY